MDIRTALNEYKSLDEYFAPDYHQENEVLHKFKTNHPNFSNKLVDKLVHILENSNEITDKYFVADLLYLYEKFDRKLFDPLLKTAINHKDPSINRIFLRPCIMSFGPKKVADSLAEKFKRMSVVERIGISNLVYWIRPKDNGEASNLNRTILEQANKTSNLVELYHYKLCYSDKIKDSNKIPNNAVELMEAIKGNKEYEDLLFNKLGWIPPLS